MPAHDPMTRIYLHPIPEIADRAPATTRCGDAVRVSDLAACVAENRATIDEDRVIIDRLCGTIDRLSAEVAELRAGRDTAHAAKDAAFEEGKREGRRSVLDGTAEAARQLADHAYETVSAAASRIPPQLEDACLSTRGGRCSRDVTVEVNGTEVTVAVTPGVTDPHEVWRDLLANHG